MRVIGECWGGEGEKSRLGERYRPSPSQPNRIGRWARSELGPFLIRSSSSAEMRKTRDSAIVPLSLARWFSWFGKCPPEASCDLAEQETSFGQDNVRPLDAAKAAFHRPSIYVLPFHHRATIGSIKNVENTIKKTSVVQAIRGSSIAGKLQSHQPPPSLPPPSAHSLAEIKHVAEVWRRRRGGDTRGSAGQFAESSDFGGGGGGAAACGGGAGGGGAGGQLG